LHEQSSLQFLANPVVFCWTTSSYSFDAVHVQKGVLWYLQGCPM
jgi:hypothetical protein